MDCSPLGSSIHGILQARILERVAISFSRGSSRLRDGNCVSFFFFVSSIALACRFFTTSATWEAPTSLVKVKVAQSNSLPPHGLYNPWDSPGQNTGVGSRSLLPGVFPTQGLNPGLPHCRQILYQLSHKGSPRFRPQLQPLACVLGCQEQKVLTVRPWEAVRGCTHPTSTPTSCLGVLSSSFHSA